MTEPQRYSVAQMEDIDPVRCPCGWARRAFASESDGSASFHIVEIETDSRTHWHARQTEIYHVLEGEGWIELDGARIPARPGTTVKIRPGCRHRAVGKLRIINVVVPAFDPGDEHFDDEAGSELARP